MDSLSSAVAAAMAAPGSSASMVAPSCRLLYSTSFRSMFVTGSPLQVQSTRPLSCTSRSLKFIHAALVSTKTDEVEDETALKEENNAIIPNSFEVQSLLMEVCDETSIAELELKVGAFELHVKRDVGKLKSSAAAVPVAPPVPSMPMVESAAPAVSPPVTSSKTQSVSAVGLLTSLASKSGSKAGLLEAGADEGLHFVTSPKVGLFRRSRVVKGKSGRPLCEEGQIVKQGQVVCYVEQLGTQQPVEVEISGEIMKILCKDGEPVGYGDPLVAIRPSFQGIK